MDALLATFVSSLPETHTSSIDRPQLISDFCETVQPDSDICEIVQPASDVREIAQLWLRKARNEPVVWANLCLWPAWSPGWKDHLEPCHRPSWPQPKTCKRNARKNLFKTGEGFELCHLPRTRIYEVCEISSFPRDSNNSHLDAYMQAAIDDSKKIGYRNKYFRACNLPHWKSRYLLTHARQDNRNHRHQFMEWTRIMHLNLCAHCVGKWVFTWIYHSRVQ